MCLYNYIFEERNVSKIEMIEIELKMEKRKEIYLYIHISGKFIIIFKSIRVMLQVWST